MHTRIAVSGGLGAGKTQLVKRLVLGQYFHAVSPADEIKLEVADALGTTPAWVDENKATTRRLLQEWGKLRRTDSPDYWIDKVLARVDQLPPETKLVADSIRGVNEVEKLAAAGFKHVRLQVSDVRKFDYLTRICGVPEDVAETMLDDETEHWLDDAPADLIVTINDDDSSPLADENVWIAVRDFIGIQEGDIV